MRAFWARQTRMTQKREKDKKRRFLAAQNQRHRSRGVRRIFPPRFPGAHGTHSTEAAGERRTLCSCESRPRRCRCISAMVSTLHSFPPPSPSHSSFASLLSALFRVRSRYTYIFYFFITGTLRGAPPVRTTRGRCCTAIGSPAYIIQARPRRPSHVCNARL